jgi:hypothetical protein
VCPSVWFCFSNRLIVLFSLLGLSTTPTTDDIEVVLASNNSNNISSSSSKTSFNSTSTFLHQQPPPLVASSTSTATSKSRLESSFHNINSLSTGSHSSSSRSGSYYLAATNTHTTAANDIVHQHLVESFAKPNHYERHDNEDNEDNHHLILNNSQNISIANWGTNNSINSSHSISSSSRGTGSSSSGGGGGNNSRIRNTSDNNKRRSIQHQPHEPDINQNHIDNAEATSSAVPKSAGEIYFGTENFTTITTQIGSVVVIPCTVYNIDEETVRLEFLLYGLWGKTHSSVIQIDMEENYAVLPTECVIYVMQLGISHSSIDIEDMYNVCLVMLFKPQISNDYRKSCENEIPRNI